MCLKTIPLRRQHREIAHGLPQAEDGLALLRQSADQPDLVQQVAVDEPGGVRAVALGLDIEADLAGLDPELVADRIEGAVGRRSCR